ncbi:hypothetical protein KUA24_39 [Vibrio phage HNL01]|nr:hypothetical protein KUA24_39 [Vibrio phage HNL01]
MLSNIDAVQNGLDKLTSELDKEGIKLLLRTLLEKQFEVQEDFIKLANVRSIDLCEGVWLDYLGEIFNLERHGMSDEDYRNELRFKVAVNSANGTPNIIMNLIKDFTESLSVEIRDSGVAFATLYFDGTKDTSSEVYKLLQSIKPAGTRWIIHSDIFQNAFRLGYEVPSINMEPFAVTLDGFTFENLQITKDGVNFTNLFVNNPTEISYYPPSIGKTIGEEEEPLPTLDVTSNGLNFNPLLLSITDTLEEEVNLNVPYLDDSVPTKNSWHYEDPFFIQITTDGNNFQDITLNTGLEEERLRVVTPYLEDYIPDNILPLTWEVWENSKNALPV